MKGAAVLDNVMKVREPLGWALLATVVGTLSIGLRQIVLLFLDPVGRAPDIAFDAVSMLPYPLVLGLFAVICSCTLRPGTRHALLLGRIAVWVLSIGSVAALGGWVFGTRALAAYGEVPRDLYSAGIGILAGIAATAALWFVVWRGDGEGTPLPALDTEEEDGEEQQPTVWKRPEAAGTAWRTASEAA